MSHGVRPAPAKQFEVYPPGATKPRAASRIGTRSTSRDFAMSATGHTLPEENAANEGGG